jgi:hypothetical protein
MVCLIITDIRKSGYDCRLCLITAIFQNTKCHDYADPQSVTKNNCNSLLALESATAEEANPSIGVRKGDHFLRIWSNSVCMFKVGDEIQL